MPRRPAKPVGPNLALALFRAVYGEDKPLTPELADIVKQALALLKQTRLSFYSLGALYAKVVEKNLAEKAGFRNVADFWVRYIPISMVSMRTIVTCGRVAAIW